MNNFCNAIVVASTVIAATLSSAQAADAFPSRPITLVVPFAAGGGPDIYCRKFAPKLEEALGQPVIVANRPGANSMIGTNFVAKSKPDGYTILYGSSSSISAARSVFKNLPYDPIKDLSGVTMIGVSYFALLVRPEDKGLTLTQFGARMKKDPARYAVAGASATQEIINAVLQRGLGSGTQYVRYASGSQMMTDMLGGRLGIAISPMAQVMPFVDGGKVHALAVTSPERLPALPNTPTMAETFPGMAQETWVGLFVPAGTPRDIIDKLNKAANKAFDDPIVRQQSDDSGRQFRTTPEETDAFTRKEVPRWAELFKLAGIEPD